MALHRHHIPILEYDDNPHAVLEPDHERLALDLPQVMVFPFLGDEVDNYALRENLPVLGTFKTITKYFPVYRVNQRICLCQAPLGSSASVQFMDWCIGYGVRKIITAGSCGALVHLPENAFLVPTKAMRDEGTSYHYLPADRYVETSPAVRQVIEAVLTEKGLPYTECVTWTTDGFYRETEALVASRRDEGCSVVEMECAGLAACAQFRRVHFGQLLYTADSLANAAAYEERDWGKASMGTALQLCLDIAEQLVEGDIENT